MLAEIVKLKVGIDGSLRLYRRLIKICTSAVASFVRIRQLAAKCAALDRGSYAAVILPNFFPNNRIW
jgi:hypothetical protein